MELIDFAKAFFGQNKKWGEVKDKDKKEYFFIVNRFLSIKYPIQAASMNYLKIDAASAMDVWYIFTSRFGKVPRWFWTKYKKEKKAKAWVPSEDALNLYKKINNIGNRDLEPILIYKRSELKKDLKKLQKVIDGPKQKN